MKNKNRFTKIDCLTMSKQEIIKKKITFQAPVNPAN